MDRLSVNLVSIRGASSGEEADDTVEDQTRVMNRFANRCEKAIVGRSDRERAMVTTPTCRATIRETATVPNMLHPSTSQSVGGLDGRRRR